MEIHTFLKQNVEEYTKKKYLLAVSGGVDSMVMLYLFQKAGLYFEVCHVNFQLRGKESNEDENFIIEICNSLKIICHVVRADTYQFAKKNDFSKQEAAREIRYQIFQKLLNERNLDFIVTAHHLNDVTENLLYTLIKSSYHQIFETIYPVNKKIIRPLIEFSKQQIIDFAQVHQINFREDSSNSLNDYSRNKIRNQVIPILKEINPSLESFLSKKWKVQQFKENFLFNHFYKVYQNSVTFYSPYVIEWKYSTKDFENNEEVLLFFQFLIDKIFYLKKIFDEQLLNLLMNSQKGKFLLDKEWVIFKEKSGLSFLPLDILNFSDEVMINEPGNFIWNIFSIEIKNSFEFPLKIRKWKPGDRFGHQKISDYFTKNNYPSWLKQIAYIIEDKNLNLVEVCSLNPKFQNLFNKC